STYSLPRPFMVLATQNPLEYEGTHPLPESQLDRFLLRIRIGYPGVGDEKTILRGAGVPSADALDAVLGVEDVLHLQAEAERVRMARRGWAPSRRRDVRIRRGGNGSRYPPPGDPSPVTLA